MAKETHFEVTTLSVEELIRTFDRLTQSAGSAGFALLSQLGDPTPIDNVNASLNESDALLKKLKESADRYCSAIKDSYNVENTAVGSKKIDKDVYGTFQDKQKYLGEKNINNLATFEGLSDPELTKENEQKKTKIMEYYANQRYLLATWELSSMLALAKTEEQIVTSRTNVVNKAYSSMGDQMRKYVELHQFSGKAFAAAVTEQVKTELIGLSARASVWALFETAMGFATLMTPVVSAAHFMAAGEFAVVSAGALAGAVGVQSLLTHNLNAGSASDPAPTHPPGGSVGVVSHAPPLPLSSMQSDQQPVQKVTINIQNGMGDAAYWQKIVENNIVPALNNAADKNITIAYA